MASHGAPQLRAGGVANHTNSLSTHISRGHRNGVYVPRRGLYRHSNDGGVRDRSLSVGWWVGLRRHLCQDAALLFSILRCVVPRRAGFDFERARLALLSQACQAFVARQCSGVDKDRMGGGGRAGEGRAGQGRALVSFSNCADASRYRYRS